MAELFGVQVPAINKHLSNIYDDGELDREATISILEIVQNEGKTVFPKLCAVTADECLSSTRKKTSATLPNGQARHPQQPEW
jgi:hypothetical protein